MGTQILEKIEISRKEFYEEKAKIGRPKWREVIKAFLESDTEAIKLKVKGTSQGTVTYLKKLFPKLDFFSRKEGDFLWIYVCKPSEGKHE